MKKSALLLFHLLFWVFTTLLIQMVFQILEAGHAFVGGPAIKNTIMFNIVPILIVLPIGAIIFYAGYFSLHYFLKKQSRFTYLLIAYFLFGAALLLPGYLAAREAQKEISPLHGILSILLFISPVLYFNVFGFLLRIFIEWILNRKIQAELEQYKLSSELELLKSKMNPHFLFNTMSNIDVLIQKDAEKASEYLNKLSDIMRFMLYETQSGKILLSKELLYIEKYLALERLRTNNNSYVKYSVSGYPGNLMIEPILFIHFIENAFKHSENKRVENAIDICFTIEYNQVKFVCKNIYSRSAHPGADYSGLGNTLIKKRLTLLYPDKHHFEIIDQNGIYSVILVISL